MLSEDNPVRSEMRWRGIPTHKDGYHVYLRSKKIFGKDRELQKKK